MFQKYITVLADAHLKMQQHLFQTAISLKNLYQLYLQLKLLLWILDTCQVAYLTSSLGSMIRHLKLDIFKTALKLPLLFSPLFFPLSSPSQLTHFILLIKSPNHNFFFNCPHIFVLFFFFYNSHCITNLVDTSFRMVLYQFRVLPPSPPPCFKSPSFLHYPVGFTAIIPEFIFLVIYRPCPLTLFSSLQQNN